MSFQLLLRNVLNICMLLPFFAFVNQVDGLPKIANQLAHSLCEQYAKYSSQNEIQPPLKSSISMDGGKSVDECGWWSWAKLMELQHGPDLHTIPPLFTYKSCPTSRGGKSDLSPEWDKEKLSHQPKTLTEAELKYFATHSDDPSKDFDQFLDPILLVRPPDTENNTKVQEFISGEMKTLGWDVEIHFFDEETPLGPKKFSNVIATLNPNVARRLVFACHFDSKLYKNFVFVGAIDSAVPCAMLIQMAHDLKSSLDLLKENPESKVSFQFLFFDGEEALVSWEGNDNTYGSRALAQRWEKMPYPEEADANGTNYIDRMDVMVLLDLLGAPSPYLASYFAPTTRWFAVLVEAEAWLRSFGLWSTDVNEDNYFGPLREKMISDDHIPFLQRRVPILHLIASTFPEVWHTEQDNKENLDFPTITNLVRVFRIFIARYLHLDMGNIP